MKSKLNFFFIFFLFEGVLIASTFEDDYDFLLKRASFINSYDASFDIIEFTLPKENIGNIERLKTFLQSGQAEIEIEQFYSDIQKLFPGRKFIKREIQKVEQAGQFKITESFNGKDRWIRTWNKEKFITYQPEQKKKQVGIYPNKQKWAEHGLNDLCMKNFLPENPILISSQRDGEEISYVFGSSGSELTKDTVYDENLTLQHMKMKYKNNDLNEKWFFGYQEKQNVPVPKIVLDIWPKKNELRINLIYVKSLDINKELTDNDFIIHNIPPSALYIDYSNDPPRVLGRIGSFKEDIMHSFLENEIADEASILSSNTANEGFNSLESKSGHDVDVSIERNRSNDTKVAKISNSIVHQEEEKEKDFKISAKAMLCIIVISVISFLILRGKKSGTA